MLFSDLSPKAASVIDDHFAALSIELLGLEAAGVSREYAERLIDEGILRADALSGLVVGRVEGEPVNPILMIRLIGQQYAEAGGAEREELRRATVREWSKRLQVPGGPRPYQVQADRPTEPTPGAVPPIGPSWLGDGDRAAVVGAYQSAGSLIRGLGSMTQGDLDRVIWEEWSGERLDYTPDPELREERLAVIREELATATIDRAPRAEVARRMRDRLGDLARNWDRIAETELQAAHMDAQLYEAMILEGEGARVAKIPDSGACGDCREAYLEPEGEPRIFAVSELLSNGTNAGRKRRNWLPVAGPMHPRCRCDMITVPENMRVDRSGRLRGVRDDEDRGSLDADQGGD